MLSDADRRLLESIAFDAAAAPAFNEITASLVWSDEIPSGLTPDGYDVVRDLVAARGYIHRGVPVDDWDSPERLERWNETLASGLRWNGFRRIATSREDKTFLDACLTDGTAL